MKTFRWLALSLTFFLLSCQPNPSSTITIVDGGQIKTFNSTERVPLVLFTQNGITPQPNDRALANGIPVSMDQPISATDSIQLQLRRAMTVNIVTPNGEQTIQSSAFTVGQALSDAGISLNANDVLNPPGETSITVPLTITYKPAREITINAGESTLKVRSTAGTVGEVLAEAGIPLIGADTSSPSQNEALPSNGQIRMVRVHETTSVELKPIPFTTKTIESVDLPLGQDNTIQLGVNGLAMIRTRFRYEDGKEVSRKTENETVIRAPQEQIVARGSQIVLAPVGEGSPYEYWVKVQMYATVYSPCNTGKPGCSYGTASGARAGQGIVAMDYSIYSLVAGMRLYIPGYGLATVGDTGGGPIIETALGVPRTSWIDLCFNEGEMRDMTGWVTVYFLAPAPAEIPYFLK